MLWDAWQEATPAMESVILKAAGGLAKIAKPSLAPDRSTKVRFPLTTIDQVSGRGSQWQRLAQ